MSIKSVAIAGASGFIGQPILEAFLASKVFQITVLTRQGSKRIFPSNVHIRVVDYESVPSLESALQGQDTLVSALGYESIDVQKNLVDAAFNAGVRRMIPSEYGNDTLNPNVATIPIYHPKIAIREYLEQKIAERTSFSYTIIMNSSFLAPGYALNFLVDVEKKRCDIKDGGNIKFSAATLETIGKAAIGILLHLDETANRPVKIKSIDTTQNELLAIAQKVEPSAQWDITYSTTQDLEKEARKSWEKGDHSESVVEKFIWRAFLAWGGYFENTDNELLGLTSLDKAGLEKIIRAAMTAP
ncbi:hypothetical protein FB567DRAFT_498026 [Paraphoma chrysanthemicola]|uniref:NmrA-like domain-containing protein n=1 Tax=Paraphoma chrysanthemicola TaxID=798071 RepID=A0A8K0R2V9_9PLEO|nr:hypothetical protein FB567DRAFT_498026 [Paraphoma chrysanthemicola]